MRQDGGIVNEAGAAMTGGRCIVIKAKHDKGMREASLMGQGVEVKVSLHGKARRWRTIPLTWK